MSEVTQILCRIGDGDSQDAARLLPLVYEELRRLAAMRMNSEKPGQTLQPTALVHDAFLCLVDGKRVTSWDSRGHFFAAAAEAMRRILVDTARRKLRVKHGADFTRIELEDSIAMSEDRADEVLALEEALQKLAQESPEKADLVKLRYFLGLNHQDAAKFLGLSRPTADRYWAYAKVFLYCELEGP